MPKGVKNPSEMEKLKKFLEELNVSKLKNQEVIKAVQYLKKELEREDLQNQIKKIEKMLKSLDDEDDAKPRKREASE